MSGENWSSRRLLREFLRKNWAWTSVDRLLKKINSTGTTERPKGSEFRKTSNLWRRSSVVIWKCSARLQKSVQNWKGDGHFTVVCSQGCTMHMASAGAGAYNEGLGAEPTPGSKGQSPWWGVRGAKPPPPWSWKAFVFLTSNGAEKFVFFCILQCLVAYYVGDLWRQSYK